MYMVKYIFFDQYNCLIFDFLVPIATILGSPEIYLDVGSTINLTCIIKHTPMPPADVQWKHNQKVKTGGTYSLHHL